MYRSKSPPSPPRPLPLASRLPRAGTPGPPPAITGAPPSDPHWPPSAVLDRNLAQRLEAVQSAIEAELAAASPQSATAEELARALPGPPPRGRVRPASALRVPGTPAAPRAAAGTPPAGADARDGPHWPPSEVLDRDLAQRLGSAESPSRSPPRSRLRLSPAPASAFDAVGRHTAGSAPARQAAARRGPQPTAAGAFQVPVPLPASTASVHPLAGRRGGAPNAVTSTGVRRATAERRTPLADEVRAAASGQGGGRFDTPEAALDGGGEPLFCVARDLAAPLAEEAAGRTGVRGESPLSGTGSDSDSDSACGGSAAAAGGPVQGGLLPIAGAGAAGAAATPAAATTVPEFSLVQTHVVQGAGGGGAAFGWGWAVPGENTGALLAPLLVLAGGRAFGVACTRAKAREHIARVRTQLGWTCSGASASNGLKKGNHGRKATYVPYTVVWRIGYVRKALRYRLRMLPPAGQESLAKNPSRWLENNTAGFAKLVTVSVMLDACELEDLESSTAATWEDAAVLQRAVKYLHSVWGLKAGSVRTAVNGVKRVVQANRMASALTGGVDAARAAACEGARSYLSTVAASMNRPASAASESKLNLGELTAEVGATISNTMVYELLCKAYLELVRVLDAYDAATPAGAAASSTAASSAAGSSAQHAGAPAARPRLRMLAQPAGVLRWAHVLAAVLVQACCGGARAALMAVVKRGWFKFEGRGPAARCFFDPAKDAELLKTGRWRGGAFPFRAEFGLAVRRFFNLTIPILDGSGKRDLDSLAASMSRLLVAGRRDWHFEPRRVRHYLLWRLPLFPREIPDELDAIGTRLASGAATHDDAIDELTRLMVKERATAPPDFATCALDAVAVKWSKALAKLNTTLLRRVVAMCQYLCWYEQLPTDHTGMKNPYLGKTWAEFVERASALANNSPEVWVRTYLPVHPSHVTRAEAVAAQASAAPIAARAGAACAGSGTETDDDAV